jgi:hypothetical protein
MNHVMQDLPRSHRERFTMARSRLVEARLRQGQKDTPAHRASVAAQLAEIDAVLDAHLDAERRNSSSPSAAA